MKTHNPLMVLRSVLLTELLYILIFGLTVVASNDFLRREAEEISTSGRECEDWSLQLGGAKLARSKPIELTLEGSHFVGPVTIAGKEYRMSFSFTASSLWVLGKEDELFMKTDSFSHSYFDEEVDADDEEEQANNNIFSTEYLDGILVFGKTKQVSSVKAGGLTISPMDIGVIDVVSSMDKGSDYSWNTHMDGVLGLGFARYTPDEAPGITPFAQLMFLNEAKVDFSGFSLYFANDGRSGELWLGRKHPGYAGNKALRRSCRYYAPLAYVDVNYDAQGWVILLDTFLMGNKALAHHPLVEVNVGSNAIWAPRAVISQVIGLTNGKATWDDEQAYVTIDCTEREGLPQLVFEFNHVPYAFEPDEYFPEFTVPEYTMEERRCTLFMMPSEDQVQDGDPLHPEQVWSLGVPFFKKFYSVYEETADEDYPELKSYRVGFAKALHQEDKQEDKL